VEPRRRSFKKIVRLWVELFDRHNRLTYASAIALRAFIGAVACASPCASSPRCSEPLLSSLPLVTSVIRGTS
jgi:hypothetical protein